MAQGAKKKAAPQGSLAAQSPRVVAPAGEPSGRFARILHETHAAGGAMQPYEVTEGLVLYPPNEARKKAMDQYSAAYLLANASAVNLIRTQGIPPDATEDGKAREVWAKTQQESLRNAYDAADEAEKKFNEALFGGPDVLQQVDEYFASRPWDERAIFEQDINKEFRRLPDNGVCQFCQSVIDAEAGESVGESSGGSSISGQSSKETSPIPSTESMPATGSEESDPGPSSSPTPTTLPE